MRRLLLILVLISLLSVQVLGVKLEVWLTGETTERVRILEEIMAETLTARTGITAEFTVLTWADSMSRVLLAAAGGETPDVATLESLGPADLGVRGATLDLREAFGDEYLRLEAQMFPGLLRSFRYKGTSFGLPVMMTTYPLFYRTDLLAEWGVAVPDTWNDLRSILPRLQAQRSNFALAWGLGETAYADVSMFLWQHGGDWYTDDQAHSALNTPGSMAGFREYVDLVTNRGVPKEIHRFQAFRDGSLAIMQGSVTDYMNITYSAAELSGKWQMGLVPGTQRDGVIDRSTYIGGSTVAIFRNTKHRDASWTFIQWLLSEETQGMYARRVMEQIPGSIFFPANFAAIQNLPISDEHKAVLMEQSFAGKAPAFALAPERITHRHIHNAINRAVLQGVSADEAILEAHRQLESELRAKQQEFRRFIERLER